MATTPPPGMEGHPVIRAVDEDQMANDADGANADEGVQREAEAAPVPITPPVDPMLVFMQMMQQNQAALQLALQQQQQQAAAAAAAAAVAQQSVLQQQMQQQQQTQLEAAALQRQQADAAAASQAAQMTKMVELMAAGQKSHNANVKLDAKNFSRIERFSNKREDWRQWRKYFMAAVRESDVDFANFLENVEKRKSEETTEGEEPATVFLNPTQSQLAAVLHSRLESVTSGEAAGIVELSGGNGVEAWRLLDKRFDPHTDGRMVDLIKRIFVFRVSDKPENVQADIVAWEQMVADLSRDHQETFSPNIKRAFLSAILPSWLAMKITEHMDRLKTYEKVKEKVISICETSPGRSRVNQLDAEDWGQWGPSWDEQQPESTEEELAAIAAGDTCHNCGGRGHFSRECPSPQKPKGGGKGGKGGKGKYGKGGGGKGGKGDRPQKLCTNCAAKPELAYKKNSHNNDGCWDLHPELRRPKKVQSVEGGEALGGIELNAIDVGLDDIGALSDCAVEDVRNPSDHVESVCVLSHLVIRAGEDKHTVNSFAHLSQDSDDEEEDIYAEKACLQAKFVKEHPQTQLARILEKPSCRTSGAEPPVRWSLPVVPGKDSKTPRSREAPRSPEVRAVVPHTKINMTSGSADPIQICPVENEWSIRTRKGRERQEQEKMVQALTDTHFTKVCIDSGAGVSVCPLNAFPSYPTTQDASSGKVYRAAGGQGLTDKGEKKPNFTAGGKAVTLKFRATDVAKPLVSAAGITAKGNRIVLDDVCSESYIENKSTGIKIPLTVEQGVYMMEMSVQPFQRL